MNEWTRFKDLILRPADRTGIVNEVIGHRARISSDDGAIETIADNPIGAQVNDKVLIRDGRVIQKIAYTFDVTVYYV